SAQASAFIPSGEAAARLRIRLPTLYSYVSRGLIRTKAHPIDPRARLYSAADLAALTARRERERRPGRAAATALDWGLPVLETRLSSIENGRLRFRNVDAVALAQTASLEDVAALLWDAPVDGFAAGPRPVPAPTAARATDRAICRLAALVPDD